MTPVLMHSVVIINSGKTPTSSLDLRKTIMHGVNKADIIKKELDGNAKAVDRLFPESAPYSDVELTPRWDYDIEKANMLNCEPALQTVPDTVAPYEFAPINFCSDSAATPTEAPGSLAPNCLHYTLDFVLLDGDALH